MPHLTPFPFSKTVSYLELPAISAVIPQGYGAVCGHQEPQAALEGSKRGRSGITLWVTGNSWQNWDSGLVFPALQSHPRISPGPAARFRACVTSRAAEGAMTV